MGALEELLVGERADVASIREVQAGGGDDQVLDHAQRLLAEHRAWLGLEVVLVHQLGQPATPAEGLDDVLQKDDLVDRVMLRLSKFL